VTLALEPADTDASRALQGAFFADIAARYPGWDPSRSQSADPSDLAPPRGAWIVAYLDGRPVACGGLKALDTLTVEIRRVYVDPSARGLGIGRTLLEGLESRARHLGYERARLTTADRQPEALGLFRSAGYHEIPAFNDNTFTRHWMEKIL
jgi:GNAT superfamily N-acetyltransferase